MNVIGRRADPISITAYFLCISNYLIFMRPYRLTDWQRSSKASFQGSNPCGGILF